MNTEKAKDPLDALQSLINDVVRVLLLELARRRRSCVTRCAVTALGGLEPIADCQ